MDNIIENYNIKKSVLNESDSFIHLKIGDMVSLSYKINNSKWIHFSDILQETSLCELLLKCIINMKEKEHIQFECNYNDFKHDEIKDLLDLDIKICFAEVKIAKIYSYSNTFKIEKWHVEWSNSPKLIEQYDEITYTYDTSDKPILCDYDITKYNAKKFVLKLEEIPKTLKNGILSMRGGDCCIFKIFDLYHIVKIYDISKIYMIDVEKNNYMKKIKICNDNKKIQYEANITYQISKKYEDLDKNIKHCKIGTDNIPLKIEKCIYNIGIGDEIAIYENNLLDCYVRLIDIKNKIQENRKTDIELYYDSISKKIEGNKLYENEEYEKAIAKYNYGLELIKSMDKEIKYNDKVINIRNHHILLLSNICQSYAKIDNNNKSSNSCQANVLELCNQILKLQPEHYKSLYRKGLIYLERNDTDRAKEYLMKASKVSPNNKIVNKSIMQLKTQILENKIKEKKMFGNMLIKGKKEESKLIKEDIDSNIVVNDNQ